MIAQLKNGRRLAISDIHGCAYTFESLLQQINFEKNDNLFVLGDMINRGKHSKKVIKTIRSLIKDGYNIFPLRGNHEQYIIAELLKNEPKEFYVFCKRLDLKWLFHKDSKELKKKYVDFFTSLPYYYDLGDRLLSHAGFDLSSNNIFENTYAMIHQRLFTHIEKIPENMRIIHGHTPISLEKITRSIECNQPIINIDNGCVYKSKDINKGNLVCLDIDTFQLYSQKNID